MKNWIILFLAGALSLSRAGGAPSFQRTISLASQWRFELDRANAGIREKWFERVLPGKIQLPGSLPAQGIGDEISIDTKWTGDIIDRSWFTAPEYARYRQPGQIKVTFWLQPDKYYVGVAWYQRDVQIPTEWQGHRVVLSLERPHWETRVWLDGKEIGSNQSLSTPHEYELGLSLAPGKHQLTIRVDNSLVVDVGVNSHCVTDHTQGNWNGIVGNILLRATAPVWIADLQVYPRVATRSALVKGKLGNATGRPGSGTLTLGIAEPREQGFLPPTRTNLTVSWTPDGGAFEMEWVLGDSAQLWDEFRPTVYVAEALLDGTKDAKSASFGLREISTQETQLLLNGRKIFFRGTLECCIFPLTGHPPTELGEWQRIIRIAKAHGLNLFRFHSYCPPAAAFDAADQLGFYYQVETCWANQSTTLGDGKPVDQWVYEETERILKAYGNHPSFLLMPFGNEPGGKNANKFLAKYVEHFRAQDSRRLWTSGSGWPQLEENQFHVVPNPRIQLWGAGLKSRINAQPPETQSDYRDFIQKCRVPVISHEIGEWCVYPNFAEIPKYKGYLKPKNLEIFRDSLSAHHLADQGPAFLLASGKLQALCYKEDIESALRTPGMGGFELLDLHDFPGQGTALVGVLDPFWEEKGYISPGEYRRFCNSTVLLARLPKRVFTTDETLEVDLEVAHFGPEPLPNAVAEWKLVGDNSGVVASGQFPARDLPLGNGIELGKINLRLDTMASPARYKLMAGLRGLGFENDWDVWVYPAKVDTSLPPEVTVTSDLDDKTVAALQAGAKALLFISPDRVRGDDHGKVALGFSSIFWNTAWTQRQAPHTLGIVCDPKHPALAQFPTEYHSNWQWWYLITRAGAMILDDLPAQLHPTIQVIDDWFTNRKLGLLFEARVGRGKLLVCSIDLQKELERDPVVRQMLHSLSEYLKSSQFNPQVALSAQQIRTVIRGAPALRSQGGRAL